MSTMKKKSQQKWLAGALLAFLLLLFPCHYSVKAEELGDFSVKAVLPENQLTSEVDYFHLLMKPSDSQDIEIQLTNHQKKKQRYQIAVNVATTSSSGHLSYSEPNKVLDKSLTYAITKLVDIPQKNVSVDGGKTKTIRLTVKTPTKPFKGILLGGITVSKQPDDKKTKDQGFSVKNALSYTIGLLLSEEEDSPIYGESALVLNSLKMKSRNEQVIVEANIQNPKPEIVKEVTVSGRIKKNGQTLVKKEQEMVKFAPNSTFSFELPVNSEGKAEAGTYWFEGVAKTDTRSWKFAKKCVVTKEQAEKLSVDNGRYIFTTVTFYILVLVFLAGGLFYWFYYRKRQR